MTPDAPFCEIIVSSPVPKGRPRFGKKGHVYTPKRTRDFEASIAWMAKAEMKGRAPLTGPVRVEVQVGYKRDADLDNFIKAALDGINRIVFKDDRQVVALTAHKGRRAILAGFMAIRVWPC